MQLSIIIVNYNVKYFLEQCLSSVYKAIQDIDAEVWVVDNASADGSLTLVEQRFTWVKTIYNERNVGFAKANNQGLAHCTGEYVLFLNPDTILPEDCLVKCISFLKQHGNAGALGIRMIDGQGSFLPESKRSFPSPITSFYKMVGLTSLFPKSRFFARYTLGYLDEHNNHEVDVLAGAFLMGRRKLLNDLKGFDETFFMYGEDIDLSYRIQKAGYKNYYFADSSIIHFKGESTRKGSLNYVRMFYQAMSIFVRKHYGGSEASVFRFFIQMAIWIRAGFSYVSNTLLRIGLPVIDSLLVYASFVFVNYLWVAQARAGENYDPQILQFAFPGFTIVFILSAIFAGMYDRQYKLAKVLYAGLVSIIVMLAFYSLLPEKYRFSRAVILFSGVTGTLLSVGIRWLLYQWKIVDDTDENSKQQQTLVVGTQAEYATVKHMLERSGLQHRIVGRVAANGRKDDAIATLAQLSTLLESSRFREVIFCEGYLSYKKIIEIIQQLPVHIYAMFHAQNSQSIVGSASKDSSGETLSIEPGFMLSQPDQLRRKRMVDLTFATAILITFPIHLLFNGHHIINHAFLVLTGQRTWVGYAHPAKNFPPLRRGILATNGSSMHDAPQLQQAGLQKIDEGYARNYHWLQDVKLILKHYKKLGTIASATD